MCSADTLVLCITTRGAAVAAVAVSRRRSRHIIPPNFDIKVTLKVIQDSVLGETTIIQ